MKTITKIAKAIESLIALPVIYMPNPLGAKIRYLYYKRKFKKMGKNVRIDEGVIIQGAEWISVGNNVHIDKYCVIAAGKGNLSGRIVKRKENLDFE